MDLMRQHKFSLQDELLQQTFKKWQYSHQYFIETSKTGIRIQEPFAFMPFVQKNNDCWHVPYVNDNFINVESHESYDFPNKWYCLKQ